MKKTTAMGIVNSYCVDLFPYLEYDKVNLTKLSKAFSIIADKNTTKVDFDKSHLLVRSYYNHPEKYFTLSAFDLIKTQKSLLSCTKDSIDKSTSAAKKYNLMKDKLTAKEEQSSAVIEFLNEGPYLLVRKTVNTLLGVNL